MSELTGQSSDVVRRLIETDGVVRTGLARGLINIRALARYVQGTTGHDSSVEAIVAAIRRYPIRRVAAKYENAGRVLTRLALKNRIVDVAIRNDPSIPLALAKFSTEVDYGRGDSFRIVAGVDVVKVVVDEKNLSKLTAVIPKSKIREILHNLAEIIVWTSEGTERTPGVVSAISTALAMNDINNIEFMSCNPQIVIVVDERDAVRSYESLRSLMKPTPKGGSLPRTAGEV